MYSTISFAIFYLCVAEANMKQHPFSRDDVPFCFQVTSVVLSQTSGGGISPKYVSHEEDKGREFLIIHLDRATAVGNTYTLAIQYVGPLTGDLQGFYLTTYKQSGQTM